MRCTMRQKQLGITKFEFVIVVSIIAILMTVFLNRIEGIMATVENTQITQASIALKQGLLLAVVQAEAQGGPLKVNPCTNPADYLEVKPTGYLGIMEPGKAIPLGSWYFDPQSCQLVYTRKFGGLNADHQPKRVRFMVEKVYNKQQEGSKSINELSNLVLKTIYAQ